MKKQLVQLWRAKASRLLLTLLCLFALQKFCSWQTADFRIYEILSEMPNSPAWETGFSQEMQTLLDQPFTYLGKGEQFYAFLGRDKQTVIKFFRHDHLSPLQLLPQTLRAKFPSRTDLTPLFRSAKLAYDRLKDETGLLALHLNKSKNLCGTVTIHDKLGIRHRIDLDATEFILQRRGDLFCTTLGKKIEQGDLQGAREQIHSLIHMLHKQCQKGVRNSDTSFKRNFGVIGDRAVTFDIGSFYLDEKVKTPAEEKQETWRTTAQLQRWLRKHYPELLKNYAVDFNDFSICKD